ncbi:hypothetical protein [Clostridium sp.]|uniref:hypothetical protein n=1 Tax=Clostridium sp. TaxID=1506 RepID=UPI003990F453
MEMKYFNNELIVIDEEIEKRYAVGDTVLIDVKCNYYGGYSGRISNLEENRLTISELNTPSSYTVAFDYIKKIV